MTKSRFVFFILGFAYLGIALGTNYSVFTITDNVLLGLSITSCLISAGELISTIRSYFLCRNSYRYSLSIASTFLEKCIAEDRKPQTNVDVYNIKKNIDDIPTGKTVSHPVEYDKKKVFIVLDSLSQILFVSGIVVFVLVPFSNLNINTQVASRIITIVAFGFMCLSIAVNDWLQEFVSAKTQFELDKIVIIEDAFNGFTYDYYNQLHHYKSYSESQKKAMEAGSESEHQNPTASDVENKEPSNILLKALKENNKK